MNTTTYQIVITSISAVHGEYPGSVDVSFHREGGDLADGVRDGFESKRVALSEAIINPDGSINQERVEAEVISNIGLWEEVERKAERLT